MTFGVVLPSFVYDEERRRLATKCFETLVNTKSPTERPALLLLIHPSEYEYPEGERFGIFDLTKIHDPVEVSGTEQSLAFGTSVSLNECRDITHVVWMGDDSAFSPYWLQELESLIGRHPEARSWSVYRSYYEAVHKTLHVDELDARPSSICGHGMTFSRHEWNEWGINWRDGKEWSSPLGSTLDMHHVCNRPGERWVTKRSYVNHTGLEGVHCRPTIPEHARDFVGVSE